MGIERPYRLSVEGGPQARRRLLGLIIGRLILVFLVVISVLLLQKGSTLTIASPAVRYLLGGTFVSVIGTSLVLVLYARLVKGLYWLAFVQIELDLLLWSIIVFLTGGVNSYFTFLFHLSIVASAVYLGDRGVIFTLVLGLAAYVLVVVSRLLDWFPGIGDLIATAMQPAPGELAVALALDIGSMVLVAMLGWVLALRVARTGESLERTQDLFADLHRLNESIVALMPSGLLTMDAGGRIRSTNAAAASLLGTTPEALTGKALACVLGGALVESDGSGRRGEIALAREGGDALLEYTTSPLLDGAGKLAGSIVLLIDVTEERRMAGRLGEFEKFRALGNLAVGLAHEIRNPLGSISGSIELVREAPSLGEEDRRLLGIVQRETDKIGKLVTSLFQLAKPPAPTLSPVDLKDLVQDVVEIFSRDREARGLHMETDVPSGLSVMADRDQFGQVIVNLLRNAAQASRESGGTIRITGRIPEPGWVEVCILDSGKGVDPDLLERIFDPYFTTKSYGIGVGLALCKEIMDRHHGKIVLENRPRGGATAILRLPAAE